MTMDPIQLRDLCDQQAAVFLPPAPGSHLGVALHTLGLQPLNGMRIEPESGTCGWYLWGGGEPSNADDFFQPVCLEHLVEFYPAALPFLALPPGWRFLTEGSYVDVWYDETLTECRRKA